MRDAFHPADNLPVNVRTQGGDFRAPDGVDGDLQATAMVTGLCPILTFKLQVVIPALKKVFESLAQILQCVAAGLFNPAIATGSRGRMCPGENIIDYLRRRHSATKHVVDLIFCSKYWRRLSDGIM